MHQPHKDEQLVAGSDFEVRLGRRSRRPVDQDAVLGGRRRHLAGRGEQHPEHGQLQLAVPGNLSSTPASRS